MEPLMNNPMKLKYHSLYGQLLQDRVLMNAWKKVKANRGSGGIDGVTIKEYAKNEQENVLELLEKLKAKEYKPTPVRRVYIPKKDGKKRPLGIPTLEDRIVQQALTDILMPKYEKLVFHNWSMGYRPGRGVESALQVIIKNIELGRNWIYDCDIKGFFDNIPHKKLMKVLNKVIADGTVLDLIWSWLKCGYMEDGKYYNTKAGQPQGGVISPLLANVYLNELDWELHKAKIYFVRYADDFLLFCETEEEVTRAGNIAKSVIESLGLEVAMNKTKVVDFKNDDFDFLGFHFNHWRTSKNGKDYYSIVPTEKSIKTFKKAIKDKTQRKWTKPKEVWIKDINPIIVGKTNYFLNVYKALKVFEGRIQTHCVIHAMSTYLDKMDSYVRQRLRMCMIHKHPTVRKSYGMHYKWNIKFFVCVGLIPSKWWFYYKMWKTYTIEKYVEYHMRRNNVNMVKRIQILKEQGVEYYTKERLKKMGYAFSR
ncbi:MAG: group II intron reverse transcriptase/maturase [Catenibacterium mitsuokai]|nr:group II intron reverse transcriptase/maturase [Catenibacterium mitsuokai]MBN2932449.1 group II intron reverse transcriptase/maturase [Catenibacterium mitsuokai]